MRTALGISTGSEVVGSALLSTAANGAQSWEFRVISADGEANTDLGDLVASSIELMTTQLPDERIEPGGIAVAYRSADQVQAVRTAVGPRRREVQLVPESAAALTYLRSTGEVARYQTVALFDLGSSGLTVSVLDQVDGTVLATRRSTEVSGRAIDAAVASYLSEQHGDSFEPATLNRKARAAKEHLSTSESVMVDGDSGASVELTRAEFDEAAGDVCASAVTFTRDVLSAAPDADVIAVVGGGGNIPLFRTALYDTLGITVLAVDEPESVHAKGAALVADSAGPLTFPVAVVRRSVPASTFARIAALIGAFAVIGLIVGYGVQLAAPGTPDAEDIVVPASTRGPETTAELVTATEAETTTSSAEPIVIETGAPFPTYEAPGVTSAATTRSGPSYTDFPTTSPSTTTTTTTATTTPPTLRPAPDLPLIPWPEIQRILPLQTYPQPPSDTTTTSPPPSPPEPSVTPETTEETEPQSPPPTQQQQQQNQPLRMWPDSGSAGR